jgi:hypothetical protein
VPDTLGNYTTYASAIIKVDTTPPSVTLAFSNLSNCTYSSATGVLTYTYNGGFFQNNRFTVTATPTDTTSGINGAVTFPTLGTGWTFTTTGNARTYTFTASATTTGPESVTAVNYAGTTGSATFTLAQG